MEDMMGKVAVVTGGATGIGRAVAARLAARGARVVIAGRNHDRGQAAARALAEEHRVAMTFVQTDVSREADVEALMAHAARLYGGIDYLFNNAGVEGTPGPITMTATRDAEKVIATNLKGVFLGTKHAIPHLLARGGGAIVNTASFLGTTMPFPDAAIYGATKAAVLSLTRAVATGFVRQGVRIHAVCPWITDTPMIDRLAGQQPDVKAQLARINPSGRIVAPDEVAGVVLAIFCGTLPLEPGDAVLVDSAGLTQRITPLAVEPLRESMTSSR